MNPNEEITINANMPPIRMKNGDNAILRTAEVGEIQKKRMYHTLRFTVSVSTVCTVPESGHRDVWCHDFSQNVFNVQFKNLRWHLGFES